jgi:hypothetical protein
LRLNFARRNRLKVFPPHAPHESPLAPSSIQLRAGASRSAAGENKSKSARDCPIQPAALFFDNSPRAEKSKRRIKKLASHGIEPQAGNLLFDFQ